MLSEEFYRISIANAILSQLKDKDNIIIKKIEEFEIPLVVKGLNRRPEN